MDGENWIITYEDKGAKKTILVAAVPELQDLKNYLNSQGLKSISAAELGIDNNEKKQTDDKKSEKSPLPIVFSAMGILSIITAILIIRRIKRKRQLRRGEQIK
ncbi:MAG: hypothetical protein MRERV_6c050 [Mycoplasmataceae bacterium RV_VA103A]|nr:MAG: hypothetical protein MRERV_6c050 [Mycoplasmataceae bacterium RV_VA103A]